ncbi:MAG: 23S rRNA (guanosine(2251)-2'-O)-methyltransferase RlmB [Flavobacteriaceae bacterium]
MNKDTLIFGIYPILEAIKSNKFIDKLFIQKGIENTKIDEIVSLSQQNSISVNYVPIEKLDQLTRGNHQGVVAIISPIEFFNFETQIEKILSNKKIPLLLILDQISDVRNFGAIIRTAECTGVDAIIIQKKGGAPVSADTVKTSAGAIFKVPICKVDHIKDAIFYLKGSGIHVIGATEKASKSVYQIDFNNPTAIVLGSEGKGITKSLFNLLDDKAALPMLGEINSLNVSVACGAFLYETVRQRSQ